MEAPLVSVIIGVLGVALLSFVFPSLAILLQIVRRTTENHLNFVPKSGPISIHVLIPAHNEAKNIGATLESINSATSSITATDISLDIWVAADGCTDETAQTALKYGAKVIEHPQNLGKWATLEQLIENTPASVDWIALVDAGASWPKNILLKIYSNLQNERLVALAPSYCNSRVSILEKMSWWFEAKIKSFENIAGGPISVHGATCFYRSASVKQVFESLRGTKWINDDVVIPLTLRSLVKNKHLVYRSDIKVEDVSVPNDNELPRRKRISRGNYQWMSSLWIGTLSKNPVVFFLALRRIFRVFWAYWFAALFLSFTYSIFFFTSKEAVVSLLVFSALALLSLNLLKKLSPLIAIFSASILSPLHIILKEQKDSAWK